MNAIEIHDLTKSYPGFTLNHLNLSLPSGCILGLVGENGAGKSTTIRLILDMIRKDGGEIKLFGRERESETEMTLVKEDIGVVLDDVGLPECLTAKQVGSVMQHTFKNWHMEEYLRLLQKLSLPDNKAFKDLSRGMKMKLGIAIALSHHAKLLLLDEPTSGLDPVVRDEVVEMLMDFTREEDHAVLISSHIVSDLEKLCDYIAFLHKGRLLLCEEKDLLLTEYGLLRCSVEQLHSLPKDSILYKQENPYGAQALLRRDSVPDDVEVSPISIEELFVLMVKEANQ